MRLFSYLQVCIYLLLYFLFFSCNKKNIIYPSSSITYDSITEGSVIMNITGGGKSEDFHSELVLKVKSGNTPRAKSYLYYGNNLLFGEKFKVKYSSYNPAYNEIMFDEPIFSKEDDIVRTQGCIVKAKRNKDTNLLCKMLFVYEIITKHGDSSGYLYIAFEDKHQYLQRKTLAIAKPGKKYVVYYKRDNPKLAILYTDSLIEGIHLKENILYYKAEDVMKNERYQRVINLLNKTIKIDSDNMLALYGRGKAYYQQDRLKKAEKDFSAYIARNNNSYDGYLYRGMIKMKQGLFSSALEDINKAIDINPTTEPDLYYYRGMIYFYMNSYEQAISNYNKAIEINPKEKAYFYNMAVAKNKRDGTESSGKLDYEKAVSLGFKGKKKALQKFKLKPENVFVKDIKRPWSKIYASFTNETGSMPCHKNAHSASMSFSYQLQNQDNGSLSSALFQNQTYFPTGPRTIFSSLGLEIGSYKGIYFIFRFAPVFQESANLWEFAGGYNIAIKNERLITIKPELGISYFEADYGLGNIDYGNKNLIALGLVHKSLDYNSYATVKLLNAIWFLKPKLGIWFFPKNLVSFKINGGYQLPFIETGKYKIDYVYSPSTRHGGSSGYRPFTPSYETNNGISLNKLYSMRGYFASVEFLIRIPSLKK